MSIEPSPRTGKKWRANFWDKEADKRKHTDFGAAGMDDFLITGDEERRRLYRQRHAKDLKTGDPTRPGYLSMWILWNKPDMPASIKDYRKRFNM